MRQKRWQLNLFASLGLLIVCGCHQNSSVQRTSATPLNTVAIDESCRDGTKRALGSSGEVLSCGFLTRKDVLEVVAGVRAAQPGGMRAFRKLVVLRRDQSHWVSELEVDNQTTNPEGYLGISFIDDSIKDSRYLVIIDKKRSDDTDGFTISLQEVTAVGEYEGVATEISWNPKVGRYQEYAANEDPIGFRPELKNPPHRQSVNCKARSTEKCS
jgi:hypothetical protein